MVDNIVERLVKLEVLLNEMDKKINRIEDNSTWMMRLVLGLVFTSIIGAALVKKNNT